MARDRLYPPSVTPGIPSLGLKPSGWIETTFGDVLQVIQRPATLNDDVDYRLVTAKRNRGGIVPREVLKGQQILVKTQFYIEVDDFIISKRQIIHGACGVVPKELDGAIVSGEYSVLRARNGLLLNYLGYFSHTVYFQQTCFQSSVGVDVEKMIFDLREWLKFRFYLPPVTEQRKIASVLSAWDQAIKCTAKLISAKQRLKSGLMQQISLGKKRFTKGIHPFVETAIGDLFSESTTGEWGDEPDDSAETIPILRSTNFTDSGQLNLGKLAYRKISREKLVKITLQPGDILFEKSGGGPGQPVGRVAFFDLEGVFGFANFLQRFAVKKGFHAKAIFYFLLNYYYSGKVMRFQQQTTGITNIQVSEFLKDTVVFPTDYTEQSRISDLLSLCDVDLTLLANKQAALQKQKKGLMQKLLTGEVRVNGVS